MINTSSTWKFSLKTANVSLDGSVTVYTLIYEEIYASCFQGMNEGFQRKAWEFKLHLFQTGLVEEEIEKHYIMLIMGEMCH